MLLLALAAVTQSPSLRPGGRAEARVHIVRGIQIREQGWGAIPPNRRREKVIVEEGRKTTLRLVEFE